MTEEKGNRPRVPPPEQGIEVNFCKNPICENFGIPARQSISRGGLEPGSHQDRYQISAGGRNYPLLKCLGCGEQPPIKSNLGVAEELARISAYLAPLESPACPNHACTNSTVSIDVPGAYQRFGTTHSGSKRYRCKECLKTFAVGSNTTGRKKLADVALVIDDLMNSKRGRRIRKGRDGKKLGGGGFYSRIDFFHGQAMRFAASFERPLTEGRPLPKLYISVDRQEYGVNWIDKKNKKNVRITNLGDYSEDHSARLLNKVTLQGIDRFFGMIRYSHSMLSRPFQAATKGAGVYNPIAAELIATVYHTSGMITSRLAYTDLQLNPLALRTQALVSAGLYKKFEKARYVLASKAKQKSLPIKFVGQSILRIQALHAFEMIPFVLLDNAIKYSPKQQPIEVRFAESRSEATAQLISIGPMAAANEVGRLTESGFRGAHASKVPGYGAGLGLFLAKQVADLHSGVRLSFLSSQQQLFELDGVPYSEFQAQVHVTP